MSEAFSHLTHRCARRLRFLFTPPALQANPRGLEFDPISAAGQAAFDDLEDAVFAKMGPLGFMDKMGVAQRLMALVEEMEQRAMQQQQAMQRAQSQGNPAANMLLSYAQQNKPEEITRILAEAGVDPSEGNSVGQTALHVACLWGNFEAAACLVAAGADVNKANKLTGGTPLHIVCTSPKPLEGRVRCAALLLENGADAVLQDGRGMSAVAYAAEEPSLLAVIKPYADRAAGGGGGLALKSAGDSNAAAEADDNDVPALMGD